MTAEETNEKGDKTTSGCCGFDDSRMFEMMGGCCTGQGGSPDCSTMMENMMEMMRIKPCCGEKTKNEPEGGRK